MNAVFADTSFYLALLRSDDSLYPRAIGELRKNRPIVTTEFIILELGNACCRAADHADFLALIAGMRASERIAIAPLDSGLLDRGLDLFASRSDKDWSLTDCISFVVMEDHGLREALTGDKHFEQAGFVALLK
ncbi:MAG: type II toxin-antitoxin system VapC family toxin [Pirellulaceae bacterium]